MTKLGRKLRTKATRATVRHSVNGLTSKAQRRPLRSAVLIAIGAVGGGSAGWFAGRKTA